MKIGYVQENIIVYTLAFENATNQEEFVEIDDELFEYVRIAKEEFFESQILLESVIKKANLKNRAAQEASDENERFLRKIQDLLNEHLGSSK